jgi:seryl-tRNA synthetase
MIDIKLVREDVDGLIKRLNTRGGDYSNLKDVVAMDEMRRDLLVQVESLKAERNESSKKIGELKRNNEDVTELLASIDDHGEKIKEFDNQVKELDKKINDILGTTPNVPRETVTIGVDENDNKELRKVMEPTKYNFTPKPHYEIAEALDIVDFERATKIAGARFSILKGAGARLERAIYNFMLDYQTEQNGFTEYLPPYMVNTKTMYGTGQLPKFEEDMFGVEDTDYWLIPTSEVPLTNLHAEEILINPELPMKFTALTPCFRREAGSAGRDTRGLIRQHQFNKVEMVMYAHPDKSYDALDMLTDHAESILKALKLPYRVIELCTGDMGFGAATTNDLEVWMPGFNTYREISSCSNCGDFQARRMNLKYKTDEMKRAEYLHTLNGSGLAVGRAFAAILENYQNEDGSVNIPEVLIPYMGGLTKIEKSNTK